MPSPGPQPNDASLPLGPSPDPRMLRVLAALRGQLPSAGPELDEVQTWVEAVRAGGAASLAGRKDLTAQAGEGSSGAGCGTALFAFALPTGIGALVALGPHSGGCDGGLCGLYLLAIPAGLIVGVVLGIITLVGSGIHHRVREDRTGGWNPAIGAGPAIRADQRFFPVEELLAGGEAAVVARRYALSEATLTSWTAVYLDGAQVELKRRHGSALQGEAPPT